MRRLRVAGTLVKVSSPRVKDGPMGWNFEWARKGCVARALVAARKAARASKTVGACAACERAKRGGGGGWVAGAVGAGRRAARSSKTGAAGAAGERAKRESRAGRKAALGRAT